jgi:hypothetical protein
LLPQALPEDSAPVGHISLIGQLPASPSQVFEIDGAFVGAVVRQDAGYLFIAIDQRLGELDGTTWPSLAHVQRLAHRLYRIAGSAAACPVSIATDDN